MSFIRSVTIIDVWCGYINMIWYMLKTGFQKSLIVSFFSALRLWIRVNLAKVYGHRLEPKTKRFSAWTNNSIMTVVCSLRLKDKLRIDMVLSLDQDIAKSSPMKVTSDPLPTNNLRWRLMTTQIWDRVRIESAMILLITIGMTSIADYSIFLIFQDNNSAWCYGCLPWKWS